MRHKLLASAAAILLMTHGAAVAQQQERQQKNEPAGHPNSAQSTPHATAPQPHTQSQAERPARKSAEKQQSNRSTAEKSPTHQQPSKSERSPAQSKTTERATKPKQKSTEATRNRDRQTTHKSAERKAQPPTDNRNAQAPDKNRSAQTPSSNETRNAQSSAPQSGKNGRPQITADQRVKLRDTFGKQRDLNRVQRTNFTASVGARVPRSIHLVVLPAAIAAIVPAYRSYEYFEVDNRICIVEPSTYEIVDVIEVGPSGVVPRSTIILSESQSRGWIGKPIFSEDGRQIGVVVEIARTPDGHAGELHANVGNFLGIGEREVRIEPNEYRLGDDRVVVQIQADQVGKLTPFHRR